MSAVNDQPTGHPPRFTPDDPYLHRVREICVALPEAKEKNSHGHPSWYTTKVFAIFGGLLRGADHWSTDHARSVLFLPDTDERLALMDQPHYFVPAYYGPSGWLGYNFDTEPDWDVVAEHVEMSFRNTALKRAIKALDGQASGSAV